MVGLAAPPRSWGRAAGLAALTVWLPVLLPLVLGTLHECGHCVSTYWVCTPIVPGLLVPFLLQLDDAWFFVVGAIATLSLFAVLALVLREVPTPWSWAAQWAVMLGVAGEAYAFACALRA